MPVTATPTINHLVWNAGADWDGQYTTACRARVLANDLGMVLIPPGSYDRGNAMSEDNDLANAPKYPVSVSAFLIDSTEVNGGLWLAVYNYGISQGYTLSAGTNKGGGAIRSILLTGMMR